MMSGDAQFSHYKNIQRRLECPRHLVGHRYTASWQAEHHYVGIGDVTREARGQLDTRICAISKNWAHRLTASVS